MIATIANMTLDRVFWGGLGVSIEWPSRFPLEIAMSEFGPNLVWTGFVLPRASEPSLLRPLPRRRSPSWRHHVFALGPLAGFLGQRRCVCGSTSDPGAHGSFRPIACWRHQKPSG